MHCSCNDTICACIYFVVNTYCTTSKQASEQIGKVCVSEYKSMTTYLAPQSNEMSPYGPSHSR